MVVAVAGKVAITRRNLEKFAGVKRYRYGVVELEDRAFYGNMTYVHNGRQYVVLQTGPKLTVLALPED